jgi:hypothetical protein
MTKQTETFRQKVRASENHVKSMTASTKEQIAIISKAQGLNVDEYSISVMAVVKNRIIRQQNKRIAAMAARRAAWREANL